MEKAGTKISTVVSKAWEVRQMTNEIMFYGGIAGAVLFGIGAVILFFVFRIYAVLGELTGITAKRSIRKIQKEGYEGKSKRHTIRENTDRIVSKRGKTTVKLHPKSKNQKEENNHETDDRTVVLNQMANEQTTVLNQDNNNQTVVLNKENIDQTVVLNQENIDRTDQTVPASQQSSFQFEIEEDVVVTHTEEKI